MNIEEKLKELETVIISLIKLATGTKVLPPTPEDIKVLDNYISNSTADGSRSDWKQGKLQATNNPNACKTTIDEQSEDSFEDYKKKSLIQREYDLEGQLLDTLGTSEVKDEPSEDPYDFDGTAFIEYMEKKDEPSEDGKLGLEVESFGDFPRDPKSIPKEKPDSENLGEDLVLWDTIQDKQRYELLAKRLKRKDYTEFIKDLKEFRETLREEDLAYVDITNSIVKWAKKHKELEK